MVIIVTTKLKPMDNEDNDGLPEIGQELVDQANRLRIFLDIDPDEEITQFIEGKNEGFVIEYNGTIPAIESTAKKLGFPSAVVVLLDKGTDDDAERVREFWVGIADISEKKLYYYDTPYSILTKPLALLELEGDETGFLFAVETEIGNEEYCFEFLDFPKDGRVILAIYKVRDEIALSN